MQSSELRQGLKSQPAWPHQFLETLVVGLVGVWTHNLPLGRLVLSQGQLITMDALENMDGLKWMLWNK